MPAIRFSGKHILVFAVLFMHLTASAQTTTTAVPFLNFSTDARSISMGQMGVATPSGSDAVFRNVAKLAFTESSSGAAVFYSPQLKGITNDVFLGSASGFFKPNEDEAFLLGLRYFNLGDIQGTLDGRDNLGSQRAHEFTVDAGYARRLSDEWGMGVAFRYINSAINPLKNNAVDHKTGTAVAADLGAFYDGRVQGDGLTGGIALTNLGSKMSYRTTSAEKDFLPANLGIGLNWHTQFTEDHSLSLGTEVNKWLVPAMNSEYMANPSEYRRISSIGGWGKSFGNFPGLTSVAFGAEYGYRHQFFLRTGFYKEHKSRGGQQFITTGAGVAIKQMNVDFSYQVPTGGKEVNHAIKKGFAISFSWKANNYQ